MNDVVARSLKFSSAVFTELTNVRSDSAAAGVISPEASLRLIWSKRAWNSTWMAAECDRIASISALASTTRARAMVKAFSTAVMTSSGQHDGVLFSIGHTVFGFVLATYVNGTFWKFVDRETA